MSLGIECLLSTDIAQAQALAVRLDELNKDRKDLESTMQQQALVALNKLQLAQNLPMGICLHEESWHQGVIGIIAGRMKDRLHRPVIAFARTGWPAVKGLRSFCASRLHIRDVLDAIAKRHPQLLEKFGGHAMAAGLSLHLDNYITFSQEFATEVGKHLSANLPNHIFTDGELNMEEFNIELAEQIRDSGP